MISRKLLLSFGLVTLPFSIFAQKVETKTLSEVLIYPQNIYPAEVVSKTQSLLSSEVSARLLEVSVEQGDLVKKNQLLAVMDCRDIKAKLALNKSSQKEVEANLNLANAQVKRFRNLEKRQLASTSQLDELKAKQNSLKAQKSGLVIQAQIINREIARCEVRSPYKAVVTELKAGEGQWLGMGTPLLQLKRFDQAQVKAMLPKEFVLNHKIESLNWQSDLNDSAAEQKVNFLRFSLDIEPGQRMVKTWFAAPENSPLGLTGKLIYQDRQSHIPASLIVKRKGKLGAFIIENKQAVFKQLPSQEVGRPLPLPSSWNTSWRIVHQGQLRLQHGDMVDD